VPSPAPSLWSGLLGVGDGAEGRTIWQAAVGVEVGPEVLQGADGPHETPGAAERPRAPGGEWHRWPRGDGGIIVVGESPLGAGPGGGKGGEGVKATAPATPQPFDTRVPWNHTKIVPSVPQQPSKGIPSLNHDWQPPSPRGPGCVLGGGVLGEDVAQRREHVPPQLQHLRGNTGPHSPSPHPRSAGDQRRIPLGITVTPQRT